MIYNKLVRDKIPQIIRQSGGIPVCRILSNEDYKRCLEQKLDEEVAEFHADKSLEELADVLEVIYALTYAYGFTTEQLMECYQKKHDARGGFTDRVFLISNDG